MIMVDEDSKDASVAEQLRETFAGAPPPAPEVPRERETAPELNDGDKSVLEELLMAAVTGAIKASVEGLGKLFSSIALIGPSLERLAAAHEKLAAESEIFNRNYDHDVHQRHHAVR
jgi:hypothetical protein